MPDSSRSRSLAYADGGKQASLLRWSTCGSRRILPNRCLHARTARSAQRANKNVDNYTRSSQQVPGKAHASGAFDEAMRHSFIANAMCRRSLAKKFARAAGARKLLAF